MSDPTDPRNYREVRFRLLDDNYEKLFSVAAFEGEHMEDVLNRAIALYEILHRAEPGGIVKWIDGSGDERRVAVLPVKIRLPWPLSWFYQQIDGR